MDKLLFRRILVAGLTALAIIYVVYLLLSANFNVVPTENAEQVTVTDKIYSNGYIIRNETYINNNKKEKIWLFKSLIPTRFGNYV